MARDRIICFFRDYIDTGQNSNKNGIHYHPKSKTIKDGLIQVCWLAWNYVTTSCVIAKWKCSLEIYSELFNRKQRSYAGKSRTFLDVVWEHSQFLMATKNSILFFLVGEYLELCRELSTYTKMVMNVCSCSSPSFILSWDSPVSEQAI